MCLPAPKGPCLREHGVAFLEEKDRGPHLSAGIQHYMLKPWDLKVVAQPLVFMRLVKDFQVRDIHECGVGERLGGRHEISSVQTPR